MKGIEIYLFMKYERYAKGITAEFKTPKDLKIFIANAGIICEVDNFLKRNPAIFISAIVKQLSLMIST